MNNFENRTTLTPLWGGTPGPLAELDVLFVFFSLFCFMEGHPGSLRFCPVFIQVLSS